MNFVAGGIYGWRVARGESRTAGEALSTMLRAWGIKVGLIVAQLWLVFSLYGDIVHAAFITTFVVTVVVFAAAIAVPDRPENKTLD